MSLSLCVSAGSKMDRHDCAGSHLWLPFAAPHQHRSTIPGQR
ncbi:hypothetical protein ACFONI_19685 [Aeromonas media]